MKKANQNLGKARAIKEGKILIRTAVNVVTLPVAVVKDVVTLGGVATEQEKPYTAQALTKLSDEAKEETFLDDLLKKLGR